MWHRFIHIAFGSCARISASRCEAHTIVSQAFGATDLNVDGWKICEIAKNGTDVWTGGVLCRLQIGAEQAGEPSSVEERIDALIGLERRTGQAQDRKSTRLNSSH